jgi:hypothetical protein
MKKTKKTSQKLTHRNFTRGVDEKRKKPQQFTRFAWGGTAQILF